MPPLPPLTLLTTFPPLPAAAVALRPALPERAVPPTVPVPLAVCALLPAAGVPALALARTVVASDALVPALALCQRPMGVPDPNSTSGSSALDPQPTAAALAIT
jgi:hypothetical protein